MVGSAGPGAGMCHPQSPCAGTAALPGPCWGPGGAAHLLTLVVTDGKLIQDKVPPLPALPLEKRRQLLGAQPCHSLRRSCTQSIPGAHSGCRGGLPALTTLPCLTQKPLLSGGGPAGGLAAEGGM